MFSRKSTVVLLLVVGACSCGPAISFAELFTYGNYNADSVVYQQVLEEDTRLIPNPNPLFGAPTVIGNAMTFNPTSFKAQASGMGGIDFVDGQLATTIVANAGYRIEKIQFAEQGDYTLFGSGTATTATGVGATLHLRVENTDGGGSFTPITFIESLIFNPSDGTFNLVDDGSGNAKPWQGGIEFDVTAALLDAGYSGKATKVYMTLDNTLTASSESGTLAFIKKKEAGGVTITTIVPEPSTVALLGMSILGLVAFAFKKRK